MDGKGWVITLEDEWMDGETVGEMTQFLKAHTEQAGGT